MIMYDSVFADFLSEPPAIHSHSSAVLGCGWNNQICALDLQWFSCFDSHRSFFLFPADQEGTFPRKAHRLGGRGANWENGAGQFLTEFEFARLFYMIFFCVSEGLLHRFAWFILMLSGRLTRVGHFPKNIVWKQAIFNCVLTVLRGFERI